MQPTRALYEGINLRYRPGRAYMIPLGIIDAALAEHAGRIRISNELSDGFFAHPPCDPDDSLDDQCSVGHEP